MKKLLRVSFAFLLLISLIAVTGCASESQTAVPVLPGSGNAEFVLTMQIGNPLMLSLIHISGKSAAKSCRAFARRQPGGAVNACTVRTVFCDL